MHVCRFLFVVCCWAICAIRLIVRAVSRALPQFRTVKSTKTRARRTEKEFVSLGKKWKMCFLFTNYDISIKIIINNVNIIISIISICLVSPLSSFLFESHILWRNQTIRRRRKYETWHRCVLTSLRVIIGVGARCGVALVFNLIPNFQSLYSARVQIHFAL